MRRVLYAAPISFERKQYERDVFIEELLNRLKFTFASFAPQWNRFGIVSANSPTKVPLELAVFADPDVDLTVDVNPGFAVFPTGEIIIIPQQLTRLPIGNQAPGAVNVLFLQFDELTEEPKLSRFNTLADTTVSFLTDTASYVQSMSLNAWQALTQDELSTKIPLALVTVASDLSLGVDNTRTILATNRPWFSPVDIEHRSGLGTGIVTTANVHGLSFNDLTAAGKTIFQLLLDTGMIVGKDIAVPKVSGHTCIDTVPAAAIQQDATGNITGVIDAFYFDLSKYPVQLLRITNTDDFNGADAGTLDIGGAVVPRRNRVIILSTDEIFDGVNIANLTVVYTSVDALMPPTDALVTNTVNLLPAASVDEAIFAGGLSIATPSLVVDFSDAGPFPLLYQTFQQADGFNYKTPQCLFCFTKLDTMGTAIQPVSFPMLGKASLRVGLTNATAGPNLDVQIQLVGEDVNGNTLSEVVTFDSTWAQDIAVGEDDEVKIATSKLYKNTTNFFTKLTTVQILVATAAGAQAGIQVWANINPIIALQTADQLPIFDAIWDGTKLVKIEDIRPINTTLHLPRVNRFIDGGEAIKLTDSLEMFEVQTIVTQPILKGTSFKHQVWVEDFDKPKMISTGFGTESPVVDVNSPLPVGTSTITSKIKEGLDRRDIYVSRAIPIKPFTAAIPLRLRFIPIGQGPFNREQFELFGFRLWARLYQSSGATIGWTHWFNVTSNPATSTFEAPLYSMRIDNSGGAVNPVKFQFVVTGEVRGMVILLELNVAPQPGQLVYDIGYWNINAWA